MGMTLSLYGIDERHADVLEANPALAWKVIAHDDPEWADEAMENAGVSADAAAQLRLDEVDEIDLDKAWHGIHYLLNGSAWEGEAPLNFLLHGGAMLGEEDEGDEPVPRLMRSGEVRDVDAALHALSIDQLRGRYDAQAMKAKDIYPSIWDEGDEARDYCLHYFGELQAFMAEAARRQRAIVIFVG